jgi:predicted DNA-binding protein (MmcQ/YjbR family)
MKMDGWHDLSAGELPKIRTEKLEGFGFRSKGDTFVYEEDLLGGDFRLFVRVAEGGLVSTLLLDTKTEEPYVLHLVEQAQGAFVGEVRTAYWEVLNRIGESCGEHGAFHGAYVDDLLQYVRETYGDEIEYPWKDMDAAVIRSHVSKKWYAVFMKILPAKIGLGGQKHIRVMNLHGTAVEVAALVDGKKCFPGYHMNRKYWYTVCLDGSIPMMELHTLIDRSFNLSQVGGHRRGKG